MGCLPLTAPRVLFAGLCSLADYLWSGYPGLPEKEKSSELPDRYPQLRPSNLWYSLTVSFNPFGCTRYQPRQRSRLQGSNPSVNCLWDNLPSLLPQKKKSSETLPKEQNVSQIWLQLDFREEQTESTQRVE